MVSTGIVRTTRRSKGRNGTWRCLGEQVDPSDAGGMSTLWTEAFGDSVAMAVAVVEEGVVGLVIAENLQVPDLGRVFDARRVVVM